MTSDPGRPFYQIGKLLFVEGIPRPEFGKFIVDKFAQSGFFLRKIVEDEKINLAYRILHLAEDVRTTYRNSLIPFGTGYCRSKRLPGVKHIYQRI